jgi:CBS domain-containing protein
MRVRDLMSTDPVTVDVDSKLQHAVRRLLDENVGSVIVTEGGDPTGLVTESDALSAAHERDVPLSAIPVAELVHQPVVTTNAGRTVQSVARQMEAEDVKKVVVLDGINLVGIITLTDIVWGLSKIRSEAINIGDQKDEWTAE